MEQDLSDTDPMPTLTIGHSPDPDDAFMWWPLGTPKRPPAIDTGRFTYLPVPEDIEVLNRRAIEQGDLDCTAISVFTYPFVRERYRLTACGGSFGDGYGPKVVCRESRGRDWLREPGLVFAVPGEKTSTFLAFSILLGQTFTYRVLPFDRIIPAVQAGDVDAGLVIHQGQLTYAEDGLDLVVDLGAWWAEETGLPLPLGANVIKRDLDARHGPGTSREVASVLRQSIEYAMKHHAEGVTEAMAYAGGLAARKTGAFIDLYVNEATLDAGERGLLAYERLLHEGHDRGLCPDPGMIDFVRGG
ncbi:MAG: ABC transporter substrate-binding protein [Phycisphaerales bacterium]|nr:ABC transporter substrate-binding protein [Phycisphaerales bacterium]